MPQIDDPLGVVQEVRLASNGLLVTLLGDRSIDLHGALLKGEATVSANSSRTVVAIEFALPLRGGKRHIILGKRCPRRKDPTLITALRRAHAMVSKDRGMPLATEVSRSPYERRIQRLAFLAPDIQRVIVDGVQPPGLNLERLIKTVLPICWDDQRKALGFKASAAACYAE